MNLNHVLNNLKINGIRCLGFIPQKEKVSQVDLGNALAGESDSSFATIAASLSNNLNGVQNKVILVTSPSLASGKTYLATNLSLALSKKYRTSLLDLDLRLPAVKTYLNVPNSQKDFEPFSYNSNLDIFCSTKFNSDPTKFLESDRLAKFIADKRSTYNFVIIDSPPLLEVHDATLLVEKSDAVLLVLRADDAGLKNIPQFHQRLFHRNSKPTFAVLNGVEKERRRSA